MTNEVLRAISERRSIRKFKPDKLTKEQIDVLMKAAAESPSAHNMQPYHFTVVNNKDILEQVNEAALEELDRRKTVHNSARNVFHSAPTVIFISVYKMSTWGKVDCGIAAQSIALAAHSIGLGSVILGLPRFAFSSDKKEYLEQLLMFPKNFEFGLAISVGIPLNTEEIKAHTVKEGNFSYILDW